MISKLPIEWVHPAWWFVCEEFLPPNEAKAVLESAIADPGAYRPSAVTNSPDGAANSNYRRSLVLYDEPTLMLLFQERLMACADSIFERLRLRPFLVKRLEVQLTSTGNGEYFKVHNDNTHTLVRSRRVSFVYYFHREPKAFRGGELRLFASRTDGSRWYQTNQYVDIEPRQNSLLVFPSFLMHEVRQVSVAPERFEDRRFSINGWFHG